MSGVILIDGMAINHSEVLTVCMCDGVVWWYLK